MAQILDAYGRPVRTARLRREIAGPSITAVRPILSTHQSVGLAPMRLAAILREAESGYAESYLDLAEEMEEKDLHYQAVLGTRRRQVSQLKITVEPADDSSEAEADAEIVREWLGRTELEDELFDIMDAVGKGFSVHEIIWEMSERQWMPAKLKYQLPRWFVFDRETGQQLMIRDPEGQHGWAELEPAKFVVHRHAAKSGLPIRGGLARSAAWAWMFKNYTLRDWVRFVEAYGMPYRVGKYDKSANAEEKNALLTAVRDIAGDAAAIIPMGMEIEFVTALPGAARTEVFSSLLEYIDAQISKAVLGQTLTTQEGQGGTGSYGLGKVHDEVRHDIERSDARQLAATLNRDVVKPLIELNRGARPMRPRIVIGREEESDPQILSEAVSKLVPVGLRVKASEMRGKLGLSEPDDGDEVLEPGGMGLPAEGDSPKEMARAIARRLGKRGSARDTDAMDAAIDALLDDEWEPAMDPLIGPVLAKAEAAVERGESLDDLRAELPEVFAAMDGDALVQVLRRAAFSATLSGMTDGS